MYQRIIKTPDVERLKQKARKLKREKSIPHTQALDEVAKEARFNHWHDVVQSNSLIIPAEKAIADGVVMAFDVKDGMDIDTSDGILVEDDLLLFLTQNQLYEIYSNFIEEDDEQGRKLKDIYPEKELKGYFVDECSFMFFRLEPGTVHTLDEVLALARKNSFWPPFYIWIKGEIFDTRNMPAQDDNGNVVGVRF